MDLNKEQYETPMTYVMSNVSGPKMNTFSSAPTSLSRLSTLVQDD